MGCGVGTQLGGVQGLPLTARTQHIENRAGTLAVGDTGTTTAKAVSVRCTGNKGCKRAQRSSEMRKPVVVLLSGLRVRVRLELQVIVFIPEHTENHSKWHLGGYSDRHLLVRSVRYDERRLPALRA